MLRVIFKYILAVTLFMGLVSCGGGGSSVKNENTTPNVTTDTSGNIVVTGQMSFTTVAIQDSTVTLKNMRFKADGNNDCIPNYSFTNGNSLDITNGGELNYKVTMDGLLCKNVNKLTFEADKFITHTYDFNGVKQENTKKEYYSKVVSFQNLDLSNNYQIKISPQPIEVGQVETFSVRITDSSDSELNNEDITSVVIKSSDSSKLSLLNEQNATVNEIAYSNLSNKNISVKAKSSGSVKLIVETILKSGSNYIKSKKDFDVEVDNGIIATNYQIGLISQNSLTVDSIGKFTIEIKDSKSDKLVDDSNVTKVTVSTTNKLLKFSSKNTGETNNNYNKDSFEYNNDNSKTIYVKTGTSSGLEILKVDATILDKNISQEFTLPIVSDYPDTISLIDVNSSYANGLYSDTYRVMATDKYGNPARAGSKIYVGAVSGLIKDDQEQDIYVTGNSTNKGTIKKSTNGIEFSVNRNNYFENVSELDTLVVLADENKLDSSYLGGWIVEDEIGSNNSLLLKGDFNITETSGLSFLVGNEKRFDSCEQQPKSVNFDSEDNTYELQKDGVTYFKLEYPPFMVGKDVYLYANSYGKKRVGVSMRRKLWGTGINANSTSCTDSKKCGNISFSLKDSNSPLTQQELYSSSNFSYTGDCNISQRIDIVNTGCSGSVDLNIYSNGGECTISWDNSIPYEH